MRTICGLARRVTTVGRAPARSVAPTAAAAERAFRHPLLSARPGPQQHEGVVLDQVDGTTCGSAVLVALATFADPDRARTLEAGPSGAAAAGGGAGFGARFDEWQRQVHRQSTRFWPQALGTSPWGMAGWLRRNAAAAGRYRVRLVDDVSAADVDDALAAATAALTAGRPVPLLVGPLVPRHYCLALTAATDGTWRVYEPTSGSVRVLDLAAVRARRLGPVLGFDRLHAVLLPA